MIRLTKLDDSPIVVSLEAIKYVEAMPDTLVFFLNGDSVIVRESVDEVVERFVALKATVMRAANEMGSGEGPASAPL